MGIARIDSPDNQKDTSGTPGYMSPEVITREQHSFPVDFFALGVIAYECMLGKVTAIPFRDLIEDTTDRK
jgi:serine/threonine protein kinase